MTEPLPPRMGRRLRRRLVAVRVVMAVALLVALIAGIGLLRTPSGPDEAERASILDAARTSVESLMTFAPDDPAKRRRETDAHLADPLRLEYRGRGADVVLPGAQASSITMTTTVVGAGLSDLAGDRARVLVFVDQIATVGEAGRPTGGGEKPMDSRESAAAGGEKTSSARWALMRKVNGNWLLSDLQPVGDVTR